MPAQSLAPRARRHEADSFARQGADPPLRFAIVAERPARRIDTRGDRRIRHDPSAPYRLQQVVLADDPIMVLHQIDQEIEDLGFDGNQLGAASQLAPLAIEHMIAEREEHLPLPKGRWPSILNKNTSDS